MIYINKSNLLLFPFPLPSPSFLQVPDFIRRTGVDLIAVTIGNVHGKYAVSPPVLDFKRLAKIRQSTDVPLVLHGASGLPSDIVKKCISMGVCKFNVNTEVRSNC